MNEVLNDGLSKIEKAGEPFVPVLEKIGRTLEVFVNGAVEVAKKIGLAAFAKNTARFMFRAVDLKRHTLQSAVKQLKYSYWVFLVCFIIGQGLALFYGKNAMGLWMAGFFALLIAFRFWIAVCVALAMMKMGKNDALSCLFGALFIAMSNVYVLFSGLLIPFVVLAMANNKKANDTN